MVESCLAINCTSRRTKKANLKFHRIPKEPNLRKLWLIAIRRENYNPGKTAVICEKHFKKEDYELNVHGNRVLKRDSVPSAFDFTAHLRKKIKARRILKRKIETVSCVPEQEESVVEKSEFHSDLHNIEVETHNIEFKTECIPSTSQAQISDVQTKVLLEEAPVRKRFPQDENLKNTWTQLLCLHKRIAKSALVCSNHFNEEDFEIKPKQQTRRYLKRNAVPRPFNPSFSESEYFSSDSTTTETPKSAKRQHVIISPRKTGSSTDTATESDNNDMEYSSNLGTLSSTSNPVRTSDTSIGNDTNVENTCFDLSHSSSTLSASSPKYYLESPPETKRTLPSTSKQVRTSDTSIRNETLIEDESLDLSYSSSTISASSPKFYLESPPETKSSDDVKIKIEDPDVFDDDLSVGSTEIETIYLREYGAKSQTVDPFGKIEKQLEKIQNCIHNEIQKDPLEQNSKNRILFLPKLADDIHLVRLNLEEIIKADRKKKMSHDREVKELKALLEKSVKENTALKKLFQERNCL